MEWISVKDRLPEQKKEHNYFISNPVLVFCDDGTIEKALYQKGDGFKNWAIIFGEDYLQLEYNEVTHWMPLPKPPKE